MILAALAAATVAAAPGAVTRDAPMPNLYSQPAHCGPVVAQEVERQRVALKGLRHDGLQYALLRQLNGCSVPTPVGYHPDYLQSGEADSPSDAAKREDAPSNRR